MKTKSLTQSAPARLPAREDFRSSPGEGGFFSPRALIALVISVATGWIVTGTLMAFLHSSAPSSASQRALTFEERVSYQRAIEEVYWRHRIWPKENLTSKPSLDAMMSKAQLEKKVADYLRNAQVLEDYWQRPISAEQLQAEMDRMAKHTKQPEVLRELFEALGEDPFVIAECLARPVLTERLSADSVANRTRPTNRNLSQPTAATASYTLPSISDADGGCADDTWTATSLIDAPIERVFHKAVWTGNEMIVWGGQDDNTTLNTGGRYNPGTDNWTATTTVNAPSARSGHTTLWTGSEMIVWGGNADNTGGRYNPGADSWTATSTTTAPSGRGNHTAVWTGGEMIVWGGVDAFGNPLNTGGKYNPATDSWAATTTGNAPSSRSTHTAVWTGTEMIVWGGSDENFVPLNTGGRYNPSTDGWIATSTTSAPTARAGHTSVWTSSEIVIWGGSSESGVVNSGGRYNPGTDNWTATSAANAPTPRVFHTGVWTGNQMVVWGGADENFISLNTGGRYCAQSGPPPTPTPTVTPTPSVSPTPSSTPTPTATPRVTPRPRPTPHPRPTPP